MKTNENRTYVQQFLAQPGAKDAYAKGSLSADIHTLIERAYADSGMSLSDLAERLEVSKARAHQLTSGEGNLTLHTVARLASAFGCTWRLGLDDIDTGEPRYVLAPIECNPATLKILEGGWAKGSVVEASRGESLIDNLAVPA